MSEYMDTPDASEGRVRDLRAIAAELVDRVNGVHGMLDCLSNCLYVASEEGHYVMSDEDRAADIEASLNLAQEELDADDTDPEAVFDHVKTARQNATQFRQGLSSDVAVQPVGKLVGADTLGEYATEIEETLASAVESVDEWASAAKHELRSESREAVMESLERYDGVGIDRRETPVQVIDHSIETERDDTTVDAFEVLVDVVGRLELDTVMERQGLLIYCRDGIEVKILGFQDRHILVEVRQERDSDDGDD